MGSVAVKFCATLPDERKIVFAQTPVLHGTTWRYDYWHPKDADPENKKSWHLALFAKAAWGNGKTTRKCP